MGIMHMVRVILVLARALAIALSPIVVAMAHVATAWPQDRRGCIPARVSVVRAERRPRAVVRAGVR
ncbi:hypothetical protein [Bradyrhizobium sp. 2TAF24]|uniref:hypothetical protein n=1 Tax=Bradyrhizobium sp. 2TAF24 TaxID=3233011 RepID=UPI003F90076C